MRLWGDLPQHLDVHKPVRYHSVEVINMESTNITNARRNLFRLAEQTVENSEPVLITSKTGDVVLLSAADYSAMQETLYILSVPGMRESLLEAAQETDGVTPEDIGWDIG